MFYKVVNKRLNDGRRQYEIGLNKDREYKEEFVEPMFYCNKQQIHYHLNDGYKLAFISLPIGNISEYRETKYVTNNMIIKKVINLKDWKMWENEKFCLETVRENGMALEYVKNPTFEIIEEALKKDEMALEYVSNETLLHAVLKDPKCLSLIPEKRQTPLMYVVALHSNPDPKIIDFIKKPINNDLIREIFMIDYHELANMNLDNDIDVNDDIDNVLITLKAVQVS
jgi:hypothetical protein